MSLSWFSYGSSFLVELEFGVLVIVEEENWSTRRKILGAKHWSVNKLGMSTIKGPLSQPPQFSMPSKLLLVLYKSCNLHGEAKSQ